MSFVLVVAIAGIVDFHYCLGSFVELPAMCSQQTYTKKNESLPVEVGFSNSHNLTFYFFVFRS